MSVATPLKAHVWERDPLDWYVEPAWCVEQLFKYEHFSDGIYDPAAGIGTIPLVAYTIGKNDITASDIAIRPGSLGFTVLRDFLTDAPSDPVYNIVTNPPFKHAVAFATRALAIARRKVAILQRQNFLGSQRRYRELFEPHPPSRVWFLCERPSMLPGPLVVAGEKAKGGTEDYCWIVWDKMDAGPTELRWIPPRGRA